MTSKARQTAEALIERDKELTNIMNSIMKAYKPLEEERRKIRATLRTYKMRGIITKYEMPKD